MFCKSELVKRYGGPFLTAGQLVFGAVMPTTDATTDDAISNAPTADTTTRKKTGKQAAAKARKARKQAAAAVSAAVRKQAAEDAAAAAAAARAAEAAGKRPLEQAAGRDITAVAGRKVQGRFGLEWEYMVQVDGIAVPLLDGESIDHLERDGNLVIDIIHHIWVQKKYAERTDNAWVQVRLGTGSHESDVSHTRPVPCGGDCP